jgi:hypothetical protein
MNTQIDNALIRGGAARQERRISLAALAAMALATTAAPRAKAAMECVVFRFIVP